MLPSGYTDRTTYVRTVVVVHRQGIIVYANATAAKACAYGSPAEMVGSRVIDLVYPDDLRTVRSFPVGVFPDAIVFAGGGSR